MNRPSSTITAAGLAGTMAGILFIIIALVSPEMYGRIQLYPGAEAHITTMIIFAIGYFKKENVLK